MALLACCLSLAADKDPKLPRDAGLILELTNAERARKDLPPLKVSTPLMKAAQRHSENMARQGLMAHELDGEGPSGRARKSGYQFTRLGENIAFGTAAKEVVRAWMRSEGHRANILGEHYTEVGIGVARDGEGRPYYTQVFAAPARADEE
jgi:uncharacterized protein YkwD